MKCFIVLGYPRVALGLRRLFAFLITEMRTTHGQLDIGSKHARRSPFETIGSNN